jgi:SAM-dependent methyltransferase
MKTISNLLRRKSGERALPLRLRLLNKRAYLVERLRGMPLPPTTMMHMVAGNHDASWYVYSGGRGAQSVRDTLEKSHIDIRSMRRVLDFGCGCGRVLRHFAPLARQTEFHGVDYNPELVYWCRRVVPFAHIERNRLEPPLVYADETFDLIYALSTFTHWTVDLQMAWIREFTRILKPGGLLMMTAHGDYYMFALTPAQREMYHAGLPVVVHEDSSGTNLCGAFTPPDFLRNELRQELEVLHHYPRSALGNPWQDVYLLRKPERAAV